MGQTRTTARGRRQARQRRHRERSVSLAASLSVTAMLLAGVLLLAVMVNLSGTAWSNFWLLNQAAGGASPGGELYRQYLAEIERQEALFVTPTCLLCGGLVLGGFMPRAITRLRLLGTAGAAGFGLMIGCLLFRWGLILFGQHGHLVTGEIDRPLLLTQAACSAAWLAVYLLGTGLGVLWRDARHRAGGGQPTEPVSPAALSR